MREDERPRVGPARGAGRWPPGSLAGKASAIEPRSDESTWADHEYQRGYAVMVLPFSSGHFLALRVSPQNPFAPYVSVWHRPPDGEWSIFVDGPSLDTACPRYWGPVTGRTAFASIDVGWTGPTELCVEVDDPTLSWTMSVSAPLHRRKLFEANASLPLWTWKRGPLLQLREWVARRALDLGDIRFAFATPSGHDTVFVPEEEYPIRESEAVLDGRSLGEPVRLEENPTIGDVPLPTRGCFVIGQVQLRIADRDEYERARGWARGDSSSGSDST